MSMISKIFRCTKFKHFVLMVMLASCVVISGGCFKSDTPGQPTKEDLAVASKISYKIEGLHHSLIDEEEASADVVVPLGLSKEQIMAVCRSAVTDIEKRCETKLKEITLSVFHSNSYGNTQNLFTCAQYILDLRGTRSEPESLYFNDYYFMDPKDYMIDGLTQTQAINLWQDLIRAERKFGIGTPETHEAQEALYHKYGLTYNNETINKLTNWALVDGFKLPPKE